MKLNEHTIISGERIYLVPYRENHVEKYHEWMKSEELQLLTASEPLSLEEEYEMQKHWRIDPDKCTFIILDKKQFDKTQNEIVAMVGDTNIFLKDMDEYMVGEIEVMIAETESRGKGMGKEAVLMMLRYGIENLNLKIYQAKILMDNIKSIKLFEELGFKKTGESLVFKEFTYEKQVDEDWINWIKAKTINYNQKQENVT